MKITYSEKLLEGTEGTNLFAVSYVKISGSVFEAFAAINVPDGKVTKQHKTKLKNEVIRIVNKQKLEMVKNKAAQELNKLSYKSKLKKYGKKGFKELMQERGRKGGISKAKNRKKEVVDNFI